MHGRRPPRASEAFFIGPGRLFKLVQQQRAANSEGWQSRGAEERSGRNSAGIVGMALQIHGICSCEFCSVTSLTARHQRSTFVVACAHQEYACQYIGHQEGMIADLIRDT